MKRVAPASLLVCLVVLATPPGLSQGLPSGAIGGTVTSQADSQPLPGVMVTLRSPSLQGVRNAVTTAHGHWSSRTSLRASTRSR